MQISFSSFSTSESFYSVTIVFLGGELYGRSHREIRKKEIGNQEAHSGSVRSVKREYERVPMGSYTFFSLVEAKDV